MFHTLIKVSYWSFPLLFLCGLFLPLVLSTCFIYLRGLVKWKWTYNCYIFPVIEPFIII
jgi:hypothetical protein